MSFGRGVATQSRKIGRQFAVESAVGTHKPAAMALDKAVALLDSATAASGVRMAVEQTLNDRHAFFVGTLLDHKSISMVRRAAAQARAGSAPAPGRAALPC